MLNSLLAGPPEAATQTAHRGDAQGSSAVGLN